MDFESIKNLTQSAYVNVFKRRDVAFVRGEGCVLYDTQGKAYVDFVAGIAVNSLGYGDPQLIEAIKEQADKVIHLSNLYYNYTQAKFVDLLKRMSGYEKVFLSNSGAEANECAIKLVRKHFYKKGSNRRNIITALNSFHGRTLATAAATGQTKYSKPYDPLPQGFKHVPFNDYKALEEAAAQPDTAAIMLETIQGEGGVVEATAEYLQTAQALAKKYGLLLVLDEVQTGIGRTGKLFSFEHFGIKPDIVTLAKGLGGGLPIGATLCADSCAHDFEPGDHGSTFGGNALACAAATVVLSRMSQDFLNQIAQKGDYLKKGLQKLVDSGRAEKVSGKGLIVGLKMPKDADLNKIIDKMLNCCYIINGCGNNTLRFVPPLIISKEQIDGMLSALQKCIQ